MSMQKKSEEKGKEICNWCVPHLNTCDFFPHLYMYKLNCKIQLEQTLLLHINIYVKKHTLEIEN